MNRTKIWSITLLSCLIVSILNTIIWAILGVNLFSFSVYLIIPIGTIALTIASLGGYYWFAKKTNYESTAADLLFLFGLALFFGLSVYLSQYVLLSLADQIHGMSFLGFLNESLTKTEYISYRYGQATNIGAAGDAGWLLFLVKFACLLASAKVVHSFADNRGDAVWKD